MQLPRTPRAAPRRISLTPLIDIVFILLLLVQGGKMTSTMTFQTAPGTGIPMSWVYSILPISAVLMMLYLIKDTVRIVKAITGRGKEA